MAQVVVPDQSTAARLAEIARVAFQGREQAWSAEDFVALGGPPHAAMIVDDDFAAGLLIMQMVADEAEILNLGVAPTAQRRGLGTELLSAAETLALELGIKCIFLEVAVDNAPARALYAGRGYSEVGRRKDYYLRRDGSRGDALILARPL